MSPSTCPALGAEGRPLAWSALFPCFILPVLDVAAPASYLALGGEGMQETHTPPDWDWGLLLIEGVYKAPNPEDCILR